MQLENRPRKKQLPSKAYHERRHGVCGLCPAGCGLTLFLDKDNPVDLFGDEFHSVNKGTLCPKALALYGQIYDSRRLPMPGIRYSPREPWRLVDWDTALKFTADRLTAIPLEKRLSRAMRVTPLILSAGQTGQRIAWGCRSGPVIFLPSLLAELAACPAYWASVRNICCATRRATGAPVRLFCWWAATWRQRHQ